MVTALGVQWGTVGEWVSGVMAGAAVIVAVIALVVTVQHAAEQTRAAQASANAAIAELAASTRPRLRVVDPPKIYGIGRLEPQYVELARQSAQEVGQTVDEAFWRRTALLNFELSVKNVGRGPARIREAMLELPNDGLECVPDSDWVEPDEVVRMTGSYPHEPASAPGVGALLIGNFWVEYGDFNDGWAEVLTCRCSPERERLILRDDYRSPDAPPHPHLRWR